MKEKLENCPLCGAKVVDAYNSVTKQFYYKCENSECHFRLPKNYTEQEVSLQGIELKAECGGCGSPLTIACGPNSLYATCLRCDYDLRPNMVNGFIFKKHANAHNIEAEQEIKELKEAYRGVIDEDYSFDDFLGTEEELQENFHEKEIISEIFKNINREEFIKYYNKGYSINQLSQQLGVSKSEIRGAKRVLLKEGAISTYVNKSHPKATITDLNKDAQITKTHREGSFLERIINFFKEHPNRKLNAQIIHEELEVGHSTVCNYLTQLRKMGTIKIVGYEGDSNPYVILYASKESPIPELETVEDDPKYITTGRFFKKYSKELTKMGLQSPTFLNIFVEKQKLKTFMILTPQGLRKTYLKSDLMHVLDIKDIKQETSKKILKKQNSQKTISEQILDFLNRVDMSTPYSAKEIANILHLNEATTIATIKTLREKGRMKIVGNNNTQMLFQLTESPLPELELKSSTEYMTPFNFYIKHKDKLESLHTIESKIRKADLPSYKIITRRGIGNGYSIKEMEKLISSTTETKPKEEVETTVADIPCSSIEYLDDAPIIQQKSNVLGFVTSIFKKKTNSDNSDNSEELISF